MNHSIQINNAHNQPITNLALFRDGSFLASMSSNQKYIRIWRTDNGNLFEELKTPSSQIGKIQDFKFNGDGSFLACSSVSSIIIYQIDGSFPNVVGEIMKFNRNKEIENKSISYTHVKGNSYIFFMKKRETTNALQIISISKDIIDFWFIEKNTVLSKIIFENLVFEKGNSTNKIIIKESLKK